MAINFKINRKRKNNRLYLKLCGDFDGASALELVRTLERASSKTDNIYIDTCDLSSIQDFGEDVFLKNCHISPIAYQKHVFCGSYGDRLTPKGGFYLNNHRKIRQTMLN